MAGYIDRTVLLNEVEKLRAYGADFENNVDLLSRGSVEEMILDAPDADVEPVIRAKWIADDKNLCYRCSNCGCISCVGESKRCATCGAHMEKRAPVRPAWMNKEES